MAYKRKYTREQLVAVAREMGLYPKENATEDEIAKLRIEQEKARRKLTVKYAHLRG